MMSTLSSLLIQRGLIPLKVLEESLALQVIQGGLLDTFLLEKKLLDEKLLLTALSEMTGYPPVQPDFLQNVTTLYADLIDVEEAKREGICPIGQDQNTITILASELTDFHRVQETLQAAGKTARFIVSTELRIHQAQEAVYGKPLPPRFRELLHKIDEMPPNMGPVLFKVEQSTPVIPHGSFGGGSRGGGSRGVRRDQTPVRIVVDEPSTALTPHEAVEGIRQAETRNRVLVYLARGAYRFLDAVQIYVLRDDQLLGLLALKNEKMDTQEITQQMLTIPSGSIIEEIIRDGGHYLGPIPEDATTSTLLLHAGIPTVRGLAIIPIALKQKTVCLLIGYREFQPISTDLLEPLAALAKETTCALADLIVKNKNIDLATHGSNLRATSKVAMSRSPLAHYPTASQRDESSLEDLSHRTKTGGGFPAIQPIASSPSSALEEASPAEPAIPKVLLDLVECIDRDDIEVDRALNELRAFGKYGISALVKRFPGRLRYNRQAICEKLVRERISAISREGFRELPRAQECSSIVEILVKLGRSSIPDLAPLLQHKNLDIRFFATYLLSELVYPESAALLANQLSDDEQEIRNIAVQTLLRFQRTEQYNYVLEALRQDLENLDPRPCRAAIKALAALGDGMSVPAIVDLLQDADEGIIETARTALVTLTRQNFGNQHRKWEKWWHRNHFRDRMEWLMDGLVHKDPEIRFAAAEELDEISGLSFGYRFDMPRAEQEEIRKKYLQWWIDKRTEKIQH